MEHRIGQLTHDSGDLFVGKISRDVIDVTRANTRDGYAKEVPDLEKKVLATGVPQSGTKGDLDAVDHEC
jgi:hypothetical protein